MKLHRGLRPKAPHPNMLRNLSLQVRFDRVQGFHGLSGCLGKEVRVRPDRDHLVFVLRYGRSRAQPFREAVDATDQRHGIRQIACCPFSIVRDVDKSLRELSALVMLKRRAELNCALDRVRWDGQRSRASTQVISGKRHGVEQARGNHSSPSFCRAPCFDPINDVDPDTSRQRERRGNCGHRVPIETTSRTQGPALRHAIDPAHLPSRLHFAQ